MADLIAIGYPDETIAFAAADEARDPLGPVTGAVTRPGWAAGVARVHGRATGLACHMGP